MIDKKLKKALEISDRIGTAELSELLVEIINEQKHNDFILEKASYIKMQWNIMLIHLC